MRTSISSLSALCAALLVVAPATAQSAEVQRAATALADTLTPPAAAKAQIDRQIETMRKGDTIRQTLARNPRFRAELAKNSPAVDAGIQRIGELQAESMGPVLREMQANARAEHIRHLTTSFTPAEMQEITAFYQTTAGAKFLKKQSEIVNEVSRANMEKYGQKMQEAEQAIAPRINAELRQMFPKLAPPN